MSRWQAHRGSLPWAGTTNRTGAVQPDQPRNRVHFDRQADLHARRTPEQLEQALAERLEQLRRDPPKGYPR